MNKLIIILTIGFAACISRHGGNTTIDQMAAIDSTIVTTDSTTILGEKYLGFGTNEFKLVVLNSKGDTVLNYPDMYFEFEFRDFNSDSLDDILVYQNGPAQDLFLFDKEGSRFTIVNGFINFPEAKPISSTEYYYSYHRSGCADNFWDSDLFYIDKFETHLLGNISGNECEGEKGIVVSTLINGEKKVVDKFTLDILEKYYNRKWGFIADYWTRNYSKFTM